MTGDHHPPRDSMTKEIYALLPRMTGRVTFRSKWLDMRTRDTMKSWAHAFFYVKNDWGLIEKLGRMKDLPVPLHVEEEDILRILNIPDVKHLLFEVRYLTKYIEEEFLFKVGLSIQAGRLETKMLKKSSKVHEPPVPSSKVPSKRKSDDPSALLKKKKLEEISMSTGQVPPDSSPAKLHVPGDVLKHQCLGRRKSDDLVSRVFSLILHTSFCASIGTFSHAPFYRCMELEVEFTQTLNEWNDEFVKVKYLQGEYKQKYNHKAKEVKELKIDRLQIELVEAQETITQLLKNQKVSREKVAVLEAENKKSRTLIAEKEAALFGLESSRIIEDFKKSIDFKTIIQDHLQEAREHIYNEEVKALEQQCMDEGFTGRKAGVKIDGLITSQASEDPSSDLDGAEIESELRQTFSSDDESVDVEWYFS
ncbi:hypothetical protein IEQ34_020563 [Dendrobium chrysotoxum]|uniref:Uncharacterized protein n=1 Tax=Dendrobium chrysotoxum TaxID=161865 RepID=A0AAV7G191_DENCH|nr:hypothetical protein IEQ34_020563 [Dendrobium chrysotoxum]